MKKQKVISFEVSENEKFITVDDLKNHLCNFDGSLKIILCKDTEGINYSPLVKGMIGMYMSTDDPYNGDVVHSSDELEHCVYDQEYTENALILYPVY